MITFKKACIKIVYYFYHGSGEITRKRYRLFRDMAYVISYSNWKITVPLRSAVKSSAFINLHESKGKHRLNQICNINRSLPIHQNSKCTIPHVVYPHETLASDATDPSGEWRMFVYSISVSCQYVGCLSIWRRVYVRNVSCSDCRYIRPEEELTLGKINLQKLLAVANLHFNLSW